MILQYIEKKMLEMKITIYGAFDKNSFDISSEYVSVSVYLEYTKLLLI